jgi:DNA-directed RNA polymerase subunit M/transcription elongation factor TFIIS
VARRRHNQLPAKPIRRNYADDEEKREVTEILSVLPKDHPARIGWEKNDRTTAEVTRLVPDRPDLLKPLSDALWRGGQRYPVEAAVPVRGGLVMYPPKDNETGSQTMGNPRLRAPFVCPICSCTDYAQVYVRDRNGNDKATGAYQCEKCTVMFRDAQRFTARREVVGIALDQFEDGRDTKDD